MTKKKIAFQISILAEKFYYDAIMATARQILPKHVSVPILKFFKINIVVKIIVIHYIHPQVPPHLHPTSRLQSGKQIFYCCNKLPKL